MKYDLFIILSTIKPVLTKKDVSEDGTDYEINFDEYRKLQMLNSKKVNTKDLSFIINKVKII